MTLSGLWAAVLDKLAKEDNEIVLKEIDRIKKRIEELSVCPHCKMKMSIGCSSWKDEKYGCYTNKTCSYRKEYGYGYTIDLGFESRKIVELEDLLKDRDYIRRRAVYAALLAAAKEVRKTFASLPNDDDLVDYVIKLEKRLVVGLSEEKEGKK